MYKIFFTFVLSFIFPYFVFANTGPMSESLGSGGLDFDPESIMAQNVSVEKHILLFKTSKKNLYQSGAQYVGYDFLKTKLGFSQEYIDENNISDYDGEFKGNGKTIFIKNDYGCDYSNNTSEDYYCNDSIDIAVRYYLKNNSNTKIKNQKVGFSFMKNTFINSGDLGYLQYKEKISDNSNIYVLNNENFYPKNFKVYDGKNKISSKDEFYINKTLSLYGIPEFYSVDKISTFDLSFEPNETKVITITYSLPYKAVFAGGKYIDYDYSPIFNWKDSVVKKSYIAVIGDEDNILNTSETYIDRNLKKEYKEQQTLFLERIGKHTYGIYLENVDKNKYIDNLQISFSNIEDIKNRGCCGMGAMSGKLLNTMNEGEQCYCETIEIFPSADSEKAIIKELTNIKSKSYDNRYNRTFEYSGKEYEMYIFDILK